MLILNNVSCGYGRNFSLKKIAFSLNQGEIVGIIGPNGSGKTTLLRAITKILPLASGTISFQNNDISKIKLNDFARDVAIVRQDVKAPFNISVEEFVALGRMPHQGSLQFFETTEDEKIISRAIDLTGMNALRKRLIETLSGGERQMAVIAKALAQEPKLLLLDEPTIFLDISHQIKILDLIRRLNKEESVSVLVVLHELNLASEYCDRLILLKDGRVYKSGTTRDVLTQEVIERVYNTPVIVREHPLSGKPYVLIISQETNNGVNKK